MTSITAGPFALVLISEQHFKEEYALTATPAWFRADCVYEGRNGWHIGSPSGLSIGPYKTKERADAASFKIRAVLSRTRSARAMADAIREFVREQTAAIMAEDPAAQIVTVRAGERSRFWARSSRFFRVGDLWFFHTREGIDVGPYATESQARSDLNHLIRILQQIGSGSSRRLAIYEWMRRPRAA